MSVRLLEASLIEDGDLTSMAFEWEGPAHHADSALWSIVANDARRTIQLGCKFVDGVFSAQFVNDWSSARQTNIDQQVSYDFDENELIVFFPDFRLSALLDPSFTATGWLTLGTKETSVPVTPLLG